MKLFSKIGRDLPQYPQIKGHCLEKAASKLPLLLIGAAEIHKAHIISTLLTDCDKPILVLTQDEAAARIITEDINSICGTPESGESEPTALLFPSRDFTLRSKETPSREYEQMRIGVLSALAQGRCRVVAASAEAALQHTIPPEMLSECGFTLTEGGQITTASLSKRLLRAGYSPREQVDGIAQFAIRGGIVDLFPPGSRHPVRLELWGDEIDTLSYFDLETQRRTDSVDQVDILPATEVLFEDETALRSAIEKLAKATRSERARGVFNHELERMDAGLPLESIDKYLSLAYPNAATLPDYFSNGIVFFSEYSTACERVKSYIWQQQEEQKLLLEEGELVGSLISFDDSMTELEAKLKRLPSCYMDTFARQNNSMRYIDMISMSPVQNGTFSGQFKLLCEEISPLLSEGYSLIILAGTSKAAASLASDLREAGYKADFMSEADSPSPGKVIVLAGSISSGFEYPDTKVSVLTIGRAPEQKKSRSKYKKGKQLKTLGELQVGDYVVHTAHGIGVFDGIHKLEMQGIVKDYIKISYAGTDKLYVPVSQLDSVTRYIGAQDDGKVKLNKLNSADWQKTRQRVRQAVADMADELIALYALRMQAKGFPFSPDTEWQKDFEQRFPYVETEDQLRCVEEIKADMERQSPMDRVLCGDVGFGKTEVAMRACFKAVMDSKQVAILCPTTILAWQHYQSFQKRFAGFPVEIHLLSRFRTPKQQKETLKKLKHGSVDIVIGTHRLVQKDIEFKDLGLAVVDEEQRFGVRHKERFKEMFNNVDMLTLSATPIPRTLNMAISGIRDMSVIEQAPQDRHPVQSYVLEYDKGIVMDALRRELRRGGQAYYIHNHIESISSIAAGIREEIPEARVAFAHGRMDEKELSEIWRQLIEHEIDVLVCTTIIETGVDVANCNTLIINNADHMGLSQLYQLRGRVGRSNRRAFAYFTFTRGKVLSEISAKRLSAIREFTKFGAGFHIALRDLEIRGAGSILGGKQHGHIEAVGYDMYMRLLSEAIAERKLPGLEGLLPENGIAPPKAVECRIDLKMDAHIPEDYIETTSARMDIYKKIAAIENEEDKSDVIDECIDRFGEPPTAVLSLLDVALLRSILSSHGFEEINEKPQGVQLFPQALDMEVASKLISAMKGRVLVNASTRPYITVKYPPAKRGEISRPDIVPLLREISTALLAD